MSLDLPLVFAVLMGASILAYLIFAEVPSASTVVGGFIVLLALGLVLMRRRGRPERASPADP